jgi:hypothetical protein
MLRVKGERPMTEAEWLTCNTFIPLLHAAVPRLTDRKLRLWVCGDKRCSGLPYPWGLPAIELAERVADGLATDQEREEGAAAVLAWEPQGEQEREEQVRVAHTLLADAGFFARLPTAFGYQPFDAYRMGTPELGLADRFRDIFGNPFRPVTFDPSWLTSDVTALARQMYESREFGAMPILADALQDADCDSGDILDHCRDPNATHVRGCWVVDLVLEKS